jgi:hypothetical protein
MAERTGKPDERAQKKLGLEVECVCVGTLTDKGEGIIGRDESHSRHCSAHAGYLSYSLV